MQLAIIGSRTFNDYVNAKQWIDRILSEYNLPAPTQIVSDCAKGSDAIAERYAHEYDIELRVFKADWTKYGRGAGLCATAKSSARQPYLGAVGYAEQRQPPQH